MTRGIEGEAPAAPNLTEVPSDRLLLVARMGIDGRSNGVEFTPQQAIEELKRRKASVSKA